MKYIIVGILAFAISIMGMGTGTVHAQSDCNPEKDIMLNTYVPFVGNCIKKSTKGESTDLVSVFPKLIGGVSRIVMTAIIIVGFLGILVGGFMIASDGAFGSKAAGVKLIISVIAGLILLGASGTILNLINPEFFGLDS